MDIQDLRKQIETDVYTKINTDLPSRVRKEDRLGEIAEIILNHRLLLQPLYRYVPADVYNVLSLLSEDVYLISADKMNDAYEGLVQTKSGPYRLFDEKLKTFRKATYLKSFSETANSSYMWENYADQHRGLCITYHFDKLSDDILRHLFPVHYTDKHFTCKIPHALDNSPYFYLWKTEQWQAEQEWRFVYLDDKNRTISLTNCITEVCFGVRMDENLRHSIVEAVKKAYPNRKIAFRQATTGSRKLKTQELK